jgi:maltose O-acetyltransferase
MTERQKMLAGELYDPFDPELVEAWQRTRDSLSESPRYARISADRETRNTHSSVRQRRLDVWMQPPFYCDYGANIDLGERVFFNFNCIVLDVCQVSIGEHTLLGPAVQICTPVHPLDAEIRRNQEYGKPVQIGSDVWVAGAR